MFWTFELRLASLESSTEAAAFGTLFEIKGQPPKKGCHGERMSDYLKLLADVRVLEIAEGIAGPACGQQLADLGALVIKIEPPGGDRARRWGPPFVGTDSAIFAHLNRGKSSVVLDVAQDGDRAALMALARDADVVLVHLDPAQRTAMGVDWRQLAEENPRLVVCEMTHLGLKGPYASRPGSELTVQALSGLTRYTGNAQDPARIGYETASMAGAMAAVQAVLGMLYRRMRDGVGDYAHVSLLGALLSMKSLLLAAQSEPDKWEGFHLNGPYWQPDIGWPTRDGQVTFDFRHGEREGWVKFCQAVGLGHLADDPEYADWRSTIYIGDRKATHGQVYLPAFARMTCQEASDLINGCGGISVKFQDYGEVLAHPQLAYLHALVQVPDAPEGARTQVGTPFWFEGDLVSNPEPHAAPALDDGAADWAAAAEAGRAS